MKESEGTEIVKEVNHSNFRLPADMLSHENRI